MLKVEPSIIGVWPPVKGMESHQRRVEAAPLAGEDYALAIVGREAARSNVVSPSAVNPCESSSPSSLAGGLRVVPDITMSSIYAATRNRRGGPGRLSRGIY